MPTLTRFDFHIEFENGWWKGELRGPSNKWVRVRRSRTRDGLVNNATEKVGPGAIIAIREF
jgi:hypothetical protein